MAEIRNKIARKKNGDARPNHAEEELKNNTGRQGKIVLANKRTAKNKRSLKRSSERVRIETSGKFDALLDSLVKAKRIRDKLAQLAWSKIE